MNLGGDFTMSGDKKSQKAMGTGSTIGMSIGVALSAEFVSEIEHALFQFNQAKHTAFNILVKEKRSGKSNRTNSLNLSVENQFKWEDYYANSVVQEANY